LQGRESSLLESSLLNHLSNHYLRDMSKHLHDLTVKEIRRETDDCVSVSFSIPDELTQLFDYKAGQYLTLAAQINNEEVRRSYSLCSAPHENEWRVAIKKVPFGKFSSYANETLREGDIVKAFPPDGHFTIDTDPHQQKHYLAFAAGSGITPMLSLVKTIMVNEPLSTFSLFYGNRNANSIIFKEELEDLKNTYLTRFKLYHVLSRQPSDSPLFDGRIDGDKCKLFYQLLLAQNPPDEAFLCGPAEMIFELKDVLIDLGLKKETVHFELFSSPDDHKKKQRDSIQDTEDEGQQSSIEMKLDGKIHHFELRQKGINILDAGIKHGADLPYSCKGGVCSTCKAKVLEGKVHMDVNYALEEDEMEQGYVLACQSHPRSEKVVIDFDQ